MFENVGNVEKKVIIVEGSKHEAPYAQLLFQCISKIPGVELSQPITEEEYKQMVKNETDNDKVIFLGNGKETLLQSRSIILEYEKFGMMFGCLGNRCVIRANAKKLVSTKQGTRAEQILHSSEQEQFFAYYHQQIEKYRSIMQLQRIPDKKIANHLPKYYSNIAASMAMAILEETTVYEMVSFPGFVSKLREMHKWQYQLLICEFMLNGLAQFLTNVPSKETGTPPITIVFDNADAKYAHLLNNSIQQHSQYNSVEMVEEMFIDNAKSHSSKNRIIFLGTTESSKKRTVGVKYHTFVKPYRFGWNGTHAFIDGIRSSRSSVRAFYDFSVELIAAENGLSKFMEV